MIEDRETDLAELLAEVRRIEISSRRLVVSLMTGGYSSVFRGAGIEFEGVREYVEGDDPRSVEWNVTARCGRPFVKTFVTEREQTVLFLLDLSASMSGGFGLYSARQMAARVCASLAMSAVRNNDKVGLVAFSDQVDRYVPPKKGFDHVLRVIRDCLALPGRSVLTDLGPALNFAARIRRRHAILFLVSDFLGTGYREALTLCARRHDVIAVRLASPELSVEAGEALPRTLVRLRDPESGRVTVADFADARVRRTYTERVRAWRARVEEDLRAARVDLMEVPIGREPDKDMVARPILRFFGMRQARGAKR